MWGGIGMVFLENCKSAKVYGDSKNLLCEARVSLGPMGSLLLVVPRSLDPHSGEEFLIEFMDPALGVLTCRCVLSSPLPLPDRMCSMRCEILERLSQQQRREDLKVPITVDVTVHVSRQPGDSVYVPPEGVPATVRNISAGGVYLATELVLAEGRRLWFDFRETGERLRLDARILRVEDITKRPNQPMYGYGCRFIDLSARNENQLRNYVFREEKRQRAKQARQ